MAQKAYEMGASVLVVCEQHRTPANGRWHSDTAGLSAVVTLQDMPIEEEGRPGKGYTWVRIQGIRVYSCYVSPNISMAEYKAYLSELEHSIRAHAGEIILAGDFNAKAAEWGSRTTDRRGTALADLVAGLGLTVCNIGNSCTFRRGEAESRIDVTFASAHAARSLIGWEVLEEESLSDHLYITYRLVSQLPSNVIANERGPAWCLKKLKADAFLKSFRKPSSRPDNPDQAATALVQKIHVACDASMPRRRQHPTKKPVYWWNEEISTLRRASIAARRTLQRKRRRTRALETNSEEEIAAKSARKALVDAIKRAKQHCWSELCSQIDRDPWGLPYRLVMKRFKAPQVIPGITLPGRVDSIISTLFPTRAETDLSIDPVPAVDVPLFSLTDLFDAAKTLSNGKAPGPDGITNEVIKLAVREDPIA